MKTLFIIFITFVIPNLALAQSKPCDPEIEKFNNHQLKYEQVTTGATIGLICAVNGVGVGIAFAATVVLESVPVIMWEEEDKFEELIEHKELGMVDPYQQNDSNDELLMRFHTGFGELIGSLVADSVGPYIYAWDWLKDGEVDNFTFLRGLRNAFPMAKGTAAEIAQKSFKDEKKRCGKYIHRMQCLKAEVDKRESAKTASIRYQENKKPTYTAQSSIVEPNYFFRLRSVSRLSKVLLSFGLAAI